MHRNVLDYDKLCESNLLSVSERLFCSGDGQLAWVSLVGYELPGLCDEAHDFTRKSVCLYFTFFLHILPETILGSPSPNVACDDERLLELVTINSSCEIFEFDAHNEVVGTVSVSVGTISMMTPPLYGKTIGANLSCEPHTMRSQELYMMAKQLKLHVNHSILMHTMRLLELYKIVEPVQLARQWHLIHKMRF